MRQLVAAFGLLAFLNLSLVQAGGFCPLAGPDASTPAELTTGHHGDHGDRGAIAAGGTEVVDEAPAPEQGHPICVMMGPCGLSVDVSRVFTSAALPYHSTGIRAGSDQAPSSQTTSPDIPPPRA